MLPQDKDLMRIHLDTISKEICKLGDNQDQEFAWKLNCDLIDIRENTRNHLKKEDDNMGNEHKITQQMLLDAARACGLNEVPTSHGRPTITKEMRKFLPCPFPKSEDKWFEVGEQDRELEIKDGS